MFVGSGEVLIELGMVRGVRAMVKTTEEKRLCGTGELEPEDIKSLVLKVRKVARG